ncbi:Octopine-binding periplasmic protein precursor [Pseudovibrio axinellae]|uniref:Octopine-binding periplasmic protein n=1 Tax=Pseudovibrio axinellae TaxID=989403 RepID=A0A165TZ32_9HYPH|nr:transporter substrate-binding domain-containing protein [Pseudovibrio axinellae]KZL08497.1 Octopine-binding periplasmic protein precursor [Pseudovibrio axinellae]SEP76255.1 polar amino acid transport system substrate-binding protein [Pseudovibrio axinellae]
MSFSRMALAAILTLTATSALQATEITKLRVATEGAYPPFNYTGPDGVLTGFDVEIGNALCAEMKVECEWGTQEWDGMIPGLVAGKYDAIIASMSITEERLERISFSRSYYNTPSTVAVSKDSPISEITPEALTGLLIGAQGGTTHSVVAEEVYSESDVSLYPTSEEYKLDMESGRLDAVIDDLGVLQSWINSDAGACCKIIGSLPIQPELHGQGIGVGVRKGQDELKGRFSNAIHAIRENGTYKKINDKYFSQDAFGE